MSKKSRDRSGKTPDDKPAVDDKPPAVHITETGGWYVDPGALLRSDPVRKEIEKWAELAEKSGIAETKRISDENL